VVIGTALGTHLGWRATLTLVMLLGLLGALLIAVFVADVPAPPRVFRARFATPADRRPHRSSPWSS
jgi:predicted MFS family arabinose efflux permease